MAETLRPVVHAAQRGDRQALDALAACVDRFARIFHGKLSRSLRQGYGSTIDFVLEGLAEAFADLGKFEYRSDEEFYAWASRYIRHRMASTGREALRQKRRHDNVEPLDGSTDIAAAEPTASQVIADLEVRNATASALLELQIEHPQEMEAVLLRVFENQSWSELRQTLGLSSDKRARTLFARGIDRLRPRVERTLGKAALSDLLGP